MEHLTPFDFFKITQALGLHFTQDSFNWFKTPAIRCKPETFDRRNDSRMFAFAASKLKARDIVQFAISNILVNNKNFIYKLDESMKNYTQYSKRVLSMTENFKNDLSKIGNELEKIHADVDKLFEVGYNTHPMLLKMFISDKISLETLCLIDKFCRPFSVEYDEQFGKDILWEGISLKVRKYSPFLDGKDWVIFDQSKIKMAWHDFVKDAELNVL